jgi:adenosylmethionine-8-amino-7-oxononanoate aminotransferase
VSSFFYRNLKRAYPVIQSAKGVWVSDTDGNSYLDGSSGAIVANLGHGVKPINDAICQQLSRVAFAHTSQFVSQSALDLAERIVALTPDGFRSGARAYFTSGGSESVETAIKMARAYCVETGQSARTTVVSRRNSYHGSTVGALSATGHPARRRPYLPILKAQPQVSPVYQYRCRCGNEGVCQSPACTIACADELESIFLAEGPENVLAFIAEPVVGAALGAAAPGPQYWPRVREICTKYGVLLIADDVMTGLGRVGANFGLDLWGVVPDVICLGKGLSSGYMPLGAVLASGRIVEGFECNSGVFEHGFTYSGHPVACAAGVAAVDFLAEHNLIAQVAAREAELFAGLEQLRRFDLVGDVRGRGFLSGIELVRNRKSKEPFDPDLRVSQLLAKAALKTGLLIYPGSGSIDGTNGDHVIVAPPFTISAEELQEILIRLSVALESVVTELAAQV